MIEPVNSLYPIGMPKQFNPYTLEYVEDIPEMTRYLDALERGEL